MQILITGREIQLTEAIKEYVEKKITGLDKFFDGIVRAHVTVRLESHQQKGSIFLAECRLEVPGSDIFASKTERTLYKAIDKIRDYLEGELKRHKAKLRGQAKKQRQVIRAAKAFSG